MSTGHLQKNLSWSKSIWIDFINSSSGNKQEEKGKVEVKNSKKVGGEEVSGVKGISKQL